MHSDTSTGLRVAALLGAASITASILLGVALLAKPVADQSAGQEWAAMAAPVDGGARERLRITVVGTRDPSLDSTPSIVRARHTEATLVRLHRQRRGLAKSEQA